MDEPCRTGAVELHMDRLVAWAIRFSQERPDERPVAIVAESDIDEIALFRAAKEALRGVDGSIAFIVNREAAQDYLYGSSAQNLEYLPAEGKGRRRTLPVVHVARIGTRIVGVTYTLPEGPWPDRN